MATIKSKIRTIPHFPKEGIMFRDITTLLKDAQGFRDVVDEIVNRYEGVDIDVVVGLEARGFILGGAIAHQLGKGFVPVRKAGKLPAEKTSYEYKLEYGTDVVEIHTDSINSGDKVLLVDDLLATGGTALAGAKLVEKLGGTIVEMTFIVDLPEVGGRKRLEDSGYKVFALVEFEGE
ncbi:MAG TPA: adenine phosphoribosyltransferase [Spirochaetota bacterium]|nr:adenine phosphoribosyltransferase [Spirochaetota bacterium]